MSHTDQTFIHAKSITSMDELQQAKKKAEVNATQDKLRVENNLNNLKNEGPRVLLKNVVLPIAGIGLAVYGIGKLIGAVTNEDRGRDFYAEPDYEYEEREGPVHHNTQAPRSSSSLNTILTTVNLMRIAPLALTVAKFGVEYLEKNGTVVPDLVHSILGGSEEQRSTSA